jgi:hypothetical protein
MILREVTQLYAIRAREFSEAVARLGQIDEIGPDLWILMEEIIRRHVLCNAAGDEFDRYVQEEAHFGRGVSSS